MIRRITAAALVALGLRARPVQTVAGVLTSVLGSIEQLQAVARERELSAQAKRQAVRELREEAYEDEQECARADRACARITELVS